MTYTRLVDQDPWAQIAKADGHDPPGLIDEVVPSLAAVVDDVVVGFEDFGLRASCRARNCQTFSCRLGSDISPATGSR